jgi:uncharacterized protein (TIGR02391 family)
MGFLKGGPFDPESEKQRHETALKVRRALSDYEAGIRRAADGASFSIECAFCGGGGVFPDILPTNGIETEPCPVCKGKGLNILTTTPENVLKCRFCGGEGKAWDSSGYATGDVCQVCQGTGVILLEQAPRHPEIELLWNSIHPAIAKVSRSRFEAEHYADSAEAAFKEVNATVKRMVKSDIGEELDGAPLMYRAFSPKRPIIRLGNLATESGRNIQQGFMQMFAGSMTGIRNPKAHENLEIDRSWAIHFLYVASLLMFKLDEHT